MNVESDRVVKASFLNNPRGLKHSGVIQSVEVDLIGERRRSGPDIGHLHRFVIPVDHIHLPRSSSVGGHEGVDCVRPAVEARRLIVGHGLIAVRVQKAGVPFAVRQRVEGLAIQAVRAR